MIEATIFTLLTSDAAIAALVGTRVYPAENLPQAVVYPAATYTIVSGETHYSMQGSSNLASARVQIDLYAETTDQVLALKAAVMARASGFRGPVGSPPLLLHGMFKSFERSDREDGLDGSGLRVQRKQIDFTLWFKETF